MLTKLKSHWKLLLPAAIAGLAIAAWLAFGYFGIQTLFTDDEVNEAAPVFTSGAAPSGIASDDVDAETVAEMNEVMEDEDVLAVDPADEPMPVETDEIAEPEVVELVTGNFVDRSHPAVGRAFVLSDGSPQRFLRFEDFETDNGPDLNVYLTTSSADADTSELAADFVDLGDLKGNIGPQNYEIPSDVDLDIYDTVVIWCVRFGVAFGAADLS